jgi:lambda family phage portal protein
MSNPFGMLFHRIGGVFSKGYDAGDRSNRTRKDLGWDRRAPRDEDTLLAGDGSREMIRQRCADLRRNNAIVAGVCNRISSFVVGTGIIPQAKTKDLSWNKQAEQWWDEYSKACDVRRRQNMRQLQWMSASLRPTHGGIYFHLLENGQIQPIECERIRQPQKEADRKNCVDGVRIDPSTGISLAYCVHDRDKDGGFDGARKETWISGDNLVPVVSPFWRPDQIREIPDLAPVVPHLQDIHEMNQWTLATAKAQSGYVGFLKKQGGMGMNSMPRGTSATTTARTRQVFQQDWGQVLEGFPGDDLDLKVSPTPGNTHIPYMQMQLGFCASALDFPYEFFTLDFSKCDYSRFKGVLLWVNKTCRPWRSWLNESMNQRLWNWRIAKAIKSGDLPPAPTDARMVSEWSKVEWQAPEEPWVDRQESNQADMMAIQMGLDTASRAAKRRGYDLETIRRERADEIVMTASVANENKLDPSQLEKLQIPGQTEAPQKAKQSKTDEPSKKEEPAKKDLPDADAK